MFDPEIKYIGPRHILVNNQQAPISFWKIDRDYFDKNQTVIVLGGGPSHVGIDKKLLERNNFIAINSSCRYVLDITKDKDILYFSDNSWSERFLELIKKWPGKVITSNRNTKIRLGDLVNRLNLDDLTNFMQIKPDYVQASSGHVGVCLGAYLGAKRIILIGFECCEINNQTHGHNDYRMQDLGPFQERFIPGWEGLSKRFLDLGIEIINSTPNSMIKEFEYIDFERAINYA